MADQRTEPRSLPGKIRALLGAGPLWLWLLLAGAAGGVLGLGGFTFAYAEGASYLSNDPETCINCHVMREVYDGWHNGSHKAFAVCNDCHTPHTLLAKYIIKGLNGWNHSVAFTTGRFPEPITITARNRAVALENCLYCHGDLVTAISYHDSDSPTDCLTCHAGVGHGR
jgi:cytochrome c nitrite reductase small subunit